MGGNDRVYREHSIAVVVPAYNKENPFGRMTGPLWEASRIRTWDENRAFGLPRCPRRAVR